MRCALRRWNPFRNPRLRRRSLRRLRCPSTSGRCFRSTRRTKPCSNPVPMPFPDPRSMRRRNPQSRFPNPIRRSRPILPGRLPGGNPIRRRPEWRSLRRRIPSRNLRGNPDLSLIPKRRPKPHSSPENPNRPPNPDRSQHPNPRPCPNRLRSRSLRLNPRLRLNRLRSRSLRPDLPLRLNRSSFRNPLLRQLRNPLLRRNPNTSRPRCSGWRRRPSATVTNSASSCRSTIRPRPPKSPPKSPQGPKRRKDRRSVPNLLPVPNLL